MAAIHQVKRQHNQYLAYGSCERFKEHIPPGKIHSKIMKQKGKLIFLWWDNENAAYVKNRKIFIYII